MIKVEGIRPRKQLKNFTCGPAALRTIFYFYGLNIPEKEICDAGDITEEGTDFATIRHLSHEYGFTCYSRNNGHTKEIEKWIGRGIPVLVCYQLGVPNGENGHYSVITGIDDKQIELADPANFYEGDGQKFTKPRRIRKEKFLRAWFDYDAGKRVNRWFAVIKPKAKRWKQQTKMNEDKLV